jgi:hypothetical protein
VAGNERAETGRDSTGQKAAAFVAIAGGLIAAWWLGRQSVAPTELVLDRPHRAAAAWPEGADLPLAAVVEEVPAVPKVAPAGIDPTPAALGVIDAELDRRLQSAARSFAARNDGGLPLADEATRAAIAEALAPSDQSYSDAMALVKAEQTAVIDRRIEEGRYDLIGVPGVAPPAPVRGALLTAHRGLSEGKVASVVVKKGESLALEDALDLSRRILNERTVAALELLRRQHTPGPAVKK